MKTGRHIHTHTQMVTRGGGEQWGTQECRRGIPIPSGDPQGHWPRPPQQSPCFCPDVSESSCSGRPATGSTGPRKQPGGRTADPEGPAQRPAHEAHGAPEQPAALPSKPLLSAPVRNGERLASLVLDAQRPLGDPERSCLRKVQTFPRLLPDGPEASALCLTLGPQLPPSELFPPDPRKAFLEGMNGLSSYKTQPSARLRPEQEPEIRRGGPGGAGRGGDGASGAPGWGPTEESPAPRPKVPGDAGREPGTCRAEERIPDGAGEPASTATEQVGDAVPVPQSPGAGGGRCRTLHTHPLLVLYHKEGSEPSPLLRNVQTVCKLPGF